MADIKRLGNGVIVEDNEGNKYNFPLNTIILAAEERSDMVNIKLKSYRRTIMALNYKTFTKFNASSAEELCKIIQNIIYNK